MRRTAGWAGACFAGGCATSWASVARIRRCQARPARVARMSLHRTPKEIAAVQARFQMAARRRNKPLPTLPSRPCPPGTPGAQRPATAPQATRAAGQLHRPKGARCHVLPFALHLRSDSESVRTMPGLAFCGT
jgi:hypothetical protein